MSMIIILFGVWYHGHLIIFSFKEVFYCNNDRCPALLHKTVFKKKDN